MNCNNRSFSQSDKSLTTAEIVALLVTKAPKPANMSSGTDYFAKHGDLSTDEALPDEADATALNVNVEADQPDKGATALNNKNEIRILKAVAPVAQPTAPRGDDDITSGTKPLAPSADEPTDKADVVSLRSPSGKKETKDTCGADDDTGQTSEGGETSDSPEPENNDELFDPDFYKVRVDLFDNGAGTSRSRYTAKLSVQITPESNPDRPYELFVNFYSRDRDFKKLLRKHGLDDFWYTALLGVFEEVSASGDAFAIKPTIGLMKERTRDGRQVEYTSLEYTAAILYQVEGADPVITMFYQYWQQTLTLDAAFNKQASNAPYKRGYYVDPKRAALAILAKPKALKRVSRAELGQ